MKHFFFPHDEDSGAQDILNNLVDNYIIKDKAITRETTLQAYYDVTDIIYDKRFDDDVQLSEKFKKIEVDRPTSETVSGEKTSEPDKTKSYRLQTLKLLWDTIENQYKLYTAHAVEILRGETDNAKHADRQYDASIKLALYHLVRGNLCLRISLCYYGVFDLDASDSWGNRGIEILWHGKNLLASLRDSSVWEKRAQADLYLRLTKLNLAKYYRDYARKNRRSDFDAALDEYRQVRNRVEEEYGKVVDSTQKRQYALIWMDAVINIVKIHRRKYQINISEREIVFLYNCLKSRMQEGDMQSFGTEQSDRQMFTIPALLNMADNVILGGKEHAAMTDDSFLTQDKDLEGLTGEAFEKFNDLNSYDKKRYLLLVMLDFARIRRDLHFKDNYESAIAIAIIADQWSYSLDERIGYKPGHNIDALITISSSLRKYIKFQNISDINELLQNGKIAVTIGERKYELKDSPTDENKEVTFRDFMKMLIDFANKGYLKSKAEVIKWHCLYQREPELLKPVKKEVASNPFKDEKTNCQLYFLEGLAALRSDKYVEAANIFKELLKQNEKEMRYIRLGTIGLKVRYLLANCYMSCAEFTKAEKILKYLHETLADAKKSRKSQEYKGSADAKSESQEEKKEITKESTDAEPDARVEIDLGYCYMQRGAYEDAIKIYRNLYGDGGPNAQEPRFALENVAHVRRIMGLNNYASCCIFSINGDRDREASGNNQITNGDKRKETYEKIETARKIFYYLEHSFFDAADEKKSIRNKENLETNLLKGYYTLCVGIMPGKNPITKKRLQKVQSEFEAESEAFCGQALLRAFPYFRKACRFKEAFPSRYDLLDENDMGNKARYRNEIERISVYIISLVKLYKLYQSRLGRFHKLDVDSGNAVEQETKCKQSKNDFKVSETQSSYLNGSRVALERFLLGFPANYRISLKAAIALAEWLLSIDNMLEEAKDLDMAEKANARSLQNQLYRSFSYVSIYEERGAGVFNTLKHNREFRFFNAVQRGKLCALLLAMYKPIKALKEDCCFSLKDNKKIKNLVHYTSMETLKKILMEEPRGKERTTMQEECMETRGSRFRINNCGYMNDVFEGKTFLKSIALVLNDIESVKDPLQSPLIEKYFPQISRSDKDLFPSASNVYIGSLSVKTDSFPMWSVYSAKETGCNIEFGPDYFDVKGISYLPKALRDYTLSKYTDKDYPLYVVQYIGSQFDPIYEDYQKKNEGSTTDYETFHAGYLPQKCGTMAIRYEDLFKILKQIAGRWEQLDKYLEEDQFKDAVSESKDVIRAFAADRINEIRFLFKDADYEYEGEVRVIYTDSAECSVAEINTAPEVPCVYVDIERELEKLTIRLGSRIEDATVDRYVTWLKHTKKVEKVLLAKQNRYTT